jgi:hypothetical protein
MLTAVELAERLHEGFFVEEMEELSASELDSVNQKQSKVRRWKDDCLIADTHVSGAGSLPVEIVSLPFEQEAARRRSEAEKLFVYHYQHAPSKRPVRRGTQVSYEM